MVVLSSEEDSPGENTICFRPATSGKGMRMRALGERQADRATNNPLIVVAVLSEFFCAFNIERCFRFMDRIVVKQVIIFSDILMS